jgi:hypothetical protein
MALRQYLFNKFQSIVPSLVTGQSWPQVIDTTGALSINAEGRKATYRAATPTSGENNTSVNNGVSFYLQGSATKTIRVTRVATQYTASNATPLFNTVKLSRYSALSGGTNTAITSMKMDPINAPPTASAFVVSVVNTTQTLVAIGAVDQGLDTSTTAGSIDTHRIEWTFGVRNSQEFVLRGLSDFCCLVFEVINDYSADIEWTEE